MVLFLAIERSLTKNELNILFDFGIDVPALKVSGGSDVKDTNQFIASRLYYPSVEFTNTEL